MSQFTFPYQAGIISNVQRAGAYLKAAEWAGATHNLAIKAVNLKNANPVQATVKWATGNPGKAAAIGAGAVCVAAPMLVVTPALAAVGFSANGVVGGSIAAGVQASLSNVVAGSAFATFQSAAMMGYGAPVVAGVVQAAGAVAAAAAGAMSVTKKK